MRLILKGGVWKNSEDEILKAAVMKYGLNQWSRVASLLPRKTPKQCKARWIEWLDPNVKKTEWTREEEERLLHLAKLMPAQWRTIAPLVGRTPAQCIEHYEKLLDAAQGAEAKDKKDDPRRLRPGEIDPQPEIKPARPDPVDMDEDEKEMLSEARARLANTQGKKAKRKVRERMLEEAKRLAQLQKQRELKAAGINVDGKRKKRKMEGIDYANEIPFEKRAPAGFFDTTDDDVAYADQKAAETADFKTTLLNKIEKERGAAAEAKAKADDKRKFKEMAASNLPDLLRAEAEKDPLNLRKRAPLLMPAPSVTDGELEDIARIGMRAGQAGILGGGYMLENGGDGGSVVTQGLLMPASSGMGVGEGDIEGTIVGLAASRRGATVPTRDAIMEEARNQAAQLSMQTPLFGGDNVALEQGTGYAGAAPMARRMATGPRGAAAGPGGLGGYGATPMLGDAVVGATPMLMDRLGGGAGGGASVAPGHAGPGSTLTGLTGVAGLLKGGIGGAGVGVLRDQMGINKLDRLDMPPPSVRAAGQHQHHPSAPSSALMPPPPKAGAAAQRAGHEHEQDDDAASEVYPSDSASVALGDSASVVAGRVHVGHEKELMKQLAGSIVAGLAALPKPKNEYELTVPDVPAEEADLHPTGQSLGLSAAALRGADLGTLQEEEDAAEEQARLAAEEEAERQRALARRSSALKHVPALPRPLVIDDGAVAPSMSHLLRSTDAAVRERAVAESLINDEMLKLLKRDAVQYPIAHKFFRAPKRAPVLDEISDADLSSAGQLIASERSAMAAQGAALPSAEAFAAACERIDASHIYIPSTGQYIAKADAKPDDLVAAYKQRLEDLRGMFKSESERVSKVEARVVLVTKGYETRAGKMEADIVQAHTEEGNELIRIACLSRLAADERAAVPVRLSDATALLQEATDKERSLQARYSAALKEMDQLRDKLTAAGVKV